MKRAVLAAVVALALLPTAAQANHYTCTTYPYTFFAAGAWHHYVRTYRAVNGRRYRQYHWWTGLGTVHTTTNWCPVR